MIMPFFFIYRWPAMCIHGDKSQPERDWVLTGAANTPPQQQILLYLLLLSRVICFLHVFHLQSFAAARLPSSSPLTWRRAVWVCPVFPREQPSRIHSSPNTHVTTHRQRVVRILGARFLKVPYCFSF